jgi:hypothetical protein
MDSQPFDFERFRLSLFTILEDGDDDDGDEEEPSFMDSQPFDFERFRPSLFTIVEDGDNDDDDGDEEEPRFMDSQPRDFERFRSSLFTILEDGDDEVAEPIERFSWDLEDSLVESETEPGQHRTSLSDVSEEGDQDVNLAEGEEEVVAENLPLLRRSARIAALPVVNYKESPYRPPTRRKKSKLRRSSRLAKLVPVRYEA